MNVEVRLDKEERHRRIVAELRSNPTVRIMTLAEEFGVSTETVRRDIDELSRKGLVSRTYGGAAATSMSQEPAVIERGSTMVAERERMVRLAVSLVSPGNVLMIDSGSTVEQFARRLAVEGTPVTVLTNSLAVATTLGPCETIRVIVCPGDYVAREHGVYGSATCEFIGTFHADTVILGAGGLTAGGPTDVDSEASWVKRSMIERAERSILLVDHSKFDVRQLALVTPLTALDDLITDTAPPPAIAKALKKAGVTLRIV